MQVQYNYIKLLHLVTLEVSVYTIVTGKRTNVFSVLDQDELRFYTYTPYCVGTVRQPPSKQVISFGSFTKAEDFVF